MSLQQLSVNKKNLKKLSNPNLPNTSTIASDSLLDENTP